MRKVYLFLAEGFEEIEAIATVDMLRRADIDINTISITNNLEVKGAHGIKVSADALFQNTNFNDGQMLILPGGMPGTLNLQQFEPLKKLIESYANANKYLAAICAAPLIYGQMDLLKGKEATCYPGFEQQLTEAIHSNKPVVVSDRFITSAGPGTVFQFALKLIEILSNKNQAATVAKGMLLA